MAELSYPPPHQFKLDTAMDSDTRRPFLNLSDPNGEQVGDFVPQDILRRRINQRIMDLENQFKAKMAQVDLRLDQIEDWLQWSPVKVANALRRWIWSR
jgi:hypothetical protein